MAYRDAVANLPGGHAELAAEKPSGEPPARAASGTRWAS